MSYLIPAVTEVELDAHIKQFTRFVFANYAHSNHYEKNSKGEFYARTAATSGGQEKAIDRLDGNVEGSMHHRTGDNDHYFLASRLSSPERGDVGERCPHNGTNTIHPIPVSNQK
jgi:hypothetical protein